MLIKVASARPLCAFVLGVGLAACGGSDAPAPANPSDPAGGGQTELALGTSGLPGLDWGAGTDAIMTAYPRATPTEGGLWAVGMTHRHQSITKFTIGASGLEHVDIEWIEGHGSMEACAGGWSEVRAAIDARLGPSTSDNLAAYWELAAASVTLACSPSENDRAVLSQTFAPRAAE